ncbi:MAG: GNAT family N-acetyltransferase [Geodermatophilaceae bacterium]|nr:GNAT family N-acetyltransferase [Geodermatophilaceae bacterium]
MVNVATLAALETLHTPRLRLDPMGPRHRDDVLATLADPEVLRLTGTHATNLAAGVDAHLARMATAADRADWAIIGSSDGRYLGEAVLNDLDADNASMNFRIALSGSYGEGYGTEATRAVVAYGFDVLGLHRISLGVYAFNPRAVRAYAKSGFVHEGVARDALRWDGAWHDEITMAVLATDPRP